MQSSKEKFEQYKRTKSNLMFNFKGYEISRVIAADLIGIVYRITSFKTTSFLKMFFRLDFSSVKAFISENKNKQNSFLTMGPYRGREDYYEIIDYLCKNINVKGYYDLSKSKSKLCISFLTIFISYKRVFLTKNIALTFKEKLQLWAVLVFRLNTINALEKLDLSFFNSYVAFSSVHPDEAIFTNYFQKRGIKTYSLQHGIYYIHKNIVPVDALSYENFNTDYHLCWGQYTKDEFVSFGIDKSKLLIAGYPRSVTPAHPNPSTANQCVIFLARSLFEHSNRKFLEILQYFKLSNPTIEYHFKLHPTLDVAKYESIVKKIGGQLILKNITINALLQSGNYSFAIAVNTACYYEAYMFHVPCLRFSDNTFENGISITDDIFDDNKTLQRAYKNVESLIAKGGTDDAIEQKLNYVLGHAENNYRILIEGSLQSK